MDVSTIKANLEQFEDDAAAVKTAREALDEAVENSGDIETAREAVRTAHDNLKSFYHGTLRPSIKEAVDEARADN